MTKLTQRGIARLLAARATPEPPAGLAGRIKAEIPGSIRLDRQTFEPGRRWLMPPLIEGLRPGRLAAVSILLVAGAGMVAARMPSPPDDVWKWMALSGVVHIDDIVVTAPAPPEPEGTAVATGEPQAARSVRIVVPARREVSSASGSAASADVPRGAAGDATNAFAAAGPEAAAMVATPPTRAPEARVSDGRTSLPAAAITATGTVPAHPASAQDSTIRPSRTQAVGGLGNGENAVNVVILDEAQRPCEGVTVTLERLGQGAFRARKATTDSGGTATFRAVPPASYRARAAAPAIAPAQVIVTVTSEGAPTRAELHVRALPRR